MDNLQHHLNLVNTLPRDIGVVLVLDTGLTIPPNQSPTPYCFDAIHIYGRVMDGVSGGLDADAGMEAYRYTSSGCASLNCGPNFCCCSDTA